VDSPGFTAAIVFDALDGKFSPSLVLHATEVHSMKIHARHGFTGSILALAMVALAACAPESSDSATPDLDPTDKALTEAVGSTAQPLCNNWQNGSFGYINGQVLGAGGLPVKSAEIFGQGSEGWWVDDLTGRNALFGLAVRGGQTYNFQVVSTGYPTKYYNNVFVDCGSLINVTVQL
jgi:hypothetical protein